MYRVLVLILFAFASVTQGSLPEIQHPQESLVELSDPPGLSKRGQHQPPDVPENGPALYSGLLSVRCQSPHCCRTIGLNPDVPQVSFHFVTWMTYNSIFIIQTIQYLRETTFKSRRSLGISRKMLSRMTQKTIISMSIPHLSWAWNGKITD